jgi:hypothetical protein
MEMDYTLIRHSHGLVGRQARSQPAGPGRLSVRTARTQDRPIPAPTGTRHDAASGGFSRGPKSSETFVTTAPNSNRAIHLSAPLSSPRPLARLAQNEERGCTSCEARRGRGLGQKEAKMTTTFRTHFTFRIDTWTPDGESIVEHIARRRGLSGCACHLPRRLRTLA